MSVVPVPEGATPGTMQLPLSVALRELMATKKQRGLLGMIDLSTKIAGIRLNNPTILASGILGVTGASMVGVAKSGAGAITCKSISMHPRTGHHNPIVLSYGPGLINAVGLSTQGIDAAREELSYAIKHSPSPIIASIFASDVREFGEVAAKVAEIKPAMIEVNVSCPNVQDEFGMSFGTDSKITAKVTREVKNNVKRIPVSIKLTPNVTNIVSIARAAEDAGADAITAINTLGPGIIIDVKTKKAILANKKGGVSGPAIRPIAVRCVWDIYNNVDIPIIGTGGITNGNDALEMILAGASAVGVGSAVYHHGPRVFQKINSEIEQIMKENSWTSIKDLIGGANE